MVQDVEVSLDRSATLLFKILDKVLVVMLELVIGIIPAPLPPIIQVFFIDHWGFIIMVMT